MVSELKNITGRGGAEKFMLCPSLHFLATPMHAPYAKLQNCAPWIVYRPIGPIVA